MQINLITIGKSNTSWVKEAFQEYEKRLSNSWPLKLIEIATPKRSSNTNIEKIKAQEAKLILDKITKDGLVVALDERGQQWSTLELANNLSKWQITNSNINLIIGGPDGLDKSILQRSYFTWSLSKLTLPHQLVRVLVAEQLYRAWTITIGHPYHRA